MVLVLVYMVPQHQHGPGLAPLQGPHEREAPSAGQAETEDNKGQNKKLLEVERQRRRTAERKIEDISLLEFTRQVVETLFIKHNEPSVFPQRENLLAGLRPWLISGLTPGTTW